MTEDQIGGRLLQIAEDLRMARNLAEQEDLDSLWRIREEEDKLAAEQAVRQAEQAVALPEVEVLDEQQLVQELDRSPPAGGRSAGCAGVAVTRGSVAAGPEASPLDHSGCA